MLPRIPAARPVTTRVSPLPDESTSESLVNTLPVALLPDVPLATPPASVALAVSTTATGLSFWPWIVIVTWVVELSPAASTIVYVKTSISVSAAVRRACTAEFELSMLYEYEPSALIVIAPYEPLTLLLTDPVTLATIPAATPLTDLVSPFATLSTSPSLVNTLPVASLPPAALARPPASTARPLSLTAVGVSLLP